jgi:hypothetical protein
MKSTFKDNGVIRDEDGNLIGVNLGWDFTAEHEWGVKGIKRDLGIFEKADGAARYHVTKTSKLLYGTMTIKEIEWHLIALSDWESVGEVGERFLSKWFDDDAEVLGAWSESGFVVAIRDKNVYDAIVRAFTYDDAVVTCESLFASEGQAFSNSGLKIIIQSALPQEWADKWIAAHEDWRALTEASTAAGIHEKLKAAGKTFYALSPRWKGEETESAHPVIYWLNPREQQDNNFGWYTVEDLEAWANNEGPIPKCKP